MIIEQIPEWQLGYSDDRAISDLLKTCFDTDYGNLSYFNQRPHLRLVHRDGKAIVGHMAAVFRTVRQGNNLFTIFGLADVATAPGHQGQGIASGLLKQAIALARKSDAQFILLFGEAALYVANGFKPAANSVLFAKSCPGKAAQPMRDTEPLLMVMPLADQHWNTETDVDLMGHIF